MSGGLGSRTTETQELEAWLQDNDPVTRNEDAYLVGAAVVEKAMRCVRAEEALRAIRGASPPGVVTLAEFEKFARETADAALAAVPEVNQP